MQYKDSNRSSGNRFRLIDLLIIILCLLCMAFGIYLFRNDLYATISLQNVQPVGTITIKNNTVQRRIADRVLWDRLRVESPVYLGDIIRVAELSAATLNIESQHIDIEENTLIRILLAPDGSGALQIELTDGKIGVTTSAENNSAESRALQINLMGHVVEVGAGTALAATAGKDGIALQVNEGKAVFIDNGEGESREIASGMMVAFDSEGTEQRSPAAVVTRPRPNARYVKSSPQPLPVSFMWSRVNLQPRDTLRLEIAADKNFNRVAQSVEDLDSSAEVSLEAGLWNWRLSQGGAILSSGRLTVVDAVNLSLLSPARGSLFRYRDKQPSVRFQWSAIEEAAYYDIEIAPTQDFANPRINRRIAAPFFVDSSLADGTWYWRVQPVFSSVYEGGASFSNVSFFRIEQTDQTIAEEQAVTLLEGEPLRELERSVGNEPPPEPVVALVETQPEPLPPPPPRRPPPQPARRAQPAPQPRPAPRAQPAPQTQPEPSPPEPQTQPASQVQAAPQTPPEPLPPPEPQTQPAPQVQPTPQAQPEPQQQPVPAPQTRPEPPPPPLPAPSNREPANNYRIGIEQLKARRTIVFRWAAVPGANAYIFTLYEQTASGRRQIDRVTVTSPTWTLENIGALGRGAFVWQIEAVNRNPDGEIARRGTTGENTFTMDIPLPSPVQVDIPGVLYGF